MAKKIEFYHVRNRIEIGLELIGEVRLFRRRIGGKLLAPDWLTPFCRFRIVEAKAL